MMNPVLGKVGSLFLIMAVGVLARKRRAISDEALDSLSKIVLYVTLPFLFIYVLSSRCLGRTLLTLWIAPVAAFAIILAGSLIGWIAARLLGMKGKRKNTLILIMSFQNSVFLALPIAYALFGEDGVLNVIVFNIGLNLLYFTYGIWLITRSNPSVKVHPLSKLVNPATVALALGVIMGGLCIELPRFAFEGAKILGDATIPLATLFVGAMLAKGGFDRSRVNIKEMAVIVLCKLVVMPFLFLGILGFMGEIPHLMRSIIVLQACMPSASTSPIFVRQYGGDHDLAATSVFFTTLVSIVTVPFFMSLL